MATAQDIVTDALKRTNDLGVGETEDADEADHALKQFNGLMSSQKAHGVNLSWTDLALTDEVPLEEELVFGVTAMLVGTLKEDVNDPISRTLSRQIRAGQEALENYYLQLVPLRQERGLSVMPSQRRVTGYRYDGS